MNGLIGVGIVAPIVALRVNDVLGMVVEIEFKVSVNGILSGIFAKPHIADYGLGHVLNQHAVTVACNFIPTDNG